MAVKKASMPMPMPREPGRRWWLHPHVWDAADEPPDETMEFRWSPWSRYSSISLVGEARAKSRKLAILIWRRRLAMFSDADAYHGQVGDGGEAILVVVQADGVDVVDAGQLRRRLRLALPPWTRGSTDPVAPHPGWLTSGVIKSHHI
jgi:hypothetical protein